MYPIPSEDCEFDVRLHQLGCTQPLLVSAQLQLGGYLNAEGSVQPDFLDALRQKRIPAHQQKTPGEVGRWVYAAPWYQYCMNCPSVAL